MQACCSLQNDLYANKKGSLSSEPEWVAGHGGVCLEFLGEERHGAALGADVGRDSDGFLVRLADGLAEEELGYESSGKRISGTDGVSRSVPA